LFVKFLTQKKTYNEFLEALPKLEPELMYYVVSSYYMAWHKRYCQLTKTVYLFKNLEIAYKKYYSKKDYKRIFYYICYPKLKVINDRNSIFKIMDFTAYLILTSVFLISIYDFYFLKKDKSYNL
jgi:hypothetical protein